MNRRFNALTIGSVIFALAVIFIATYFFSGSKNYIEIKGLTKNENIRIETVSGASILSHYNGSASDQIKKISLADNIKNTEKKYTLLISVDDKESGKTQDFSILVNQDQNFIKTRANGLPDQAKTSLLINNKKILSDIRSDWSGRTAFEATDHRIQRKNAQICLDIGGYRGGSLSICHTTQNGKIVPVQLGGILGGGSVDLTIVPQSFMAMTQQLNAVMVQQVQIIGMFFDAKHQLETQRLFQTLHAQAHKDYHPSEAICTVGTFVRNLSQSEGHVKLNKAALSKGMLSREIVSGDVSTKNGESSDVLSKLQTFRKYHCNPSDNANGLGALCDTPADPDNRNADINYTRTLELPLTLDFDMLSPDIRNGERNIFGLMNNLFLAQANPYIPPGQAGGDKMSKTIQELRSQAAMRGIARNSMANIIAQKASVPSGGNSAAPYMQALMQDFGLPDSEIQALLGENPSYFAQMEVLTKKLYQNPNFFTNLYDKPANVERMRAAMRAIKLMQDRDIQNALLRREMLMSMILEVDLRNKQQDAVNNGNIASYAAYRN